MEDLPKNLRSRLTKAIAIKKKKRITIQSAKGKGRNLQYFVCKEIGEMIGVVWEQKDDQCSVHSREGGQSGNDIILRGRAKKLIPFSIECKRTETFNLKSAIEQSKSNLNGFKHWMVVHRKTGMKEPIVVMDWSAWREMMEMIIEIIDE